MKNIKSHFKFNKQERSGIFFLLFIIVFLQVAYFIYGYYSSDNSKSSFAHDLETQAKIDALKKEALQKDVVKIYPFNPNFITDYKGYTLGMSVEEIDRLHAFRSQDKFANSVEEFQKVTLISDSLLGVISSYFKFPEWTKKSNTSDIGKRNSLDTSSYSSQSLIKNFSNEVLVKDLNQVTAEELKSVYGIGEKLSVRIVKFRDRLGGFLINEQLYDVYALEQETANRVLSRFKVFNKPEVQKININTNSAYEISSLVYIKYALAKEIVVYREVNGNFKSLNELVNIPNFPTEKIDRIALYLTL